MTASAVIRNGRQWVLIISLPTPSCWKAPMSFNMAAREEMYWSYNLATDSNGITMRQLPIREEQKHMPISLSGGLGLACACFSAALIQIAPADEARCLADESANSSSF